ncbi:hypothetical protein M8818_003908 [Zalaria obscura]|uniref:Uncharacterized protein n=1 Tax=Zalaria obscura TaxID=2024903 RepID=A0ACC3SES4_9PEZI
MLLARSAGLAGCFQWLGLPPSKRQVWVRFPVGATQLPQTSSHNRLELAFLQFVRSIRKCLAPRTQRRDFWRRKGAHRLSPVY